MQLTPVRSGNVVAVGYDAGAQRMRISFKSGTYDYLSVPDEIWAALQNVISDGGSIGAFVSSRVVRNFNYVRVHEVSL